MKSSCYILLIVLFCACSTGSNKETQNISFTDSTSKLQKTSQTSSINNKISSTYIKENIDFIGNYVSDFLIVNDSTYLLSTSHSIFIYSKSGNQIGVIGKQGEGPENYLNIGEICLSDKYIYVWCKTKQKLFVYDILGNLQTSYSLPNRKIISMCVYQDRFLCCMMDGTLENKIIEIYDLIESDSRRTIISDCKEIELLSCAQVAGDIKLKKNFLYWSTPAELSIYMLDLNNINGEIVQYKYDDNNFSVEKLPNKDISYDKKFIFNYINSNSRILQLSVNANGLYLMAEIGIITDNYKDRFIKIYQLNANGDLINTYKYDISENDGFFKILNDKLYILRAEDNNFDYNIVLDEYPLQ